MILDRVRIHSQVFIPEYCIIREDAWLGPSVVLTNAKYPQHPNAKRNLIGCEIKKNARIGANSTILPGVTVGEKALIGAGSVVTKNVDDMNTVVGSPAKMISSTDY